MKREAELKAQWTQEMRVRLPDFLMLQLATAGAPDRVVVGAGHTTYWEFKHATPQFDSPGLQELICMRMAEAGYCRYVIWWEGATGVGKRTLIVHPKEVHFRDGWLLRAEISTSGFDHAWLVEYIKRVHRL